MYKNIEKQTKLQLKDLVEYQTGQVVSKTLVQNDKAAWAIFILPISPPVSTLTKRFPVMPLAEMQW